MTDKKLYVETMAVFFLARLQSCEKRLLASSCLSVRMQQLSFYLTDFH